MPTWVTPKTWSLADIRPTHTQFNIDLIDNPQVLRELQNAAVRVYRTSNLAIGTSGSRAMVTWQAADWQRGSMWSGGSPTRLTAPEDGIYLQLSQLQWASNNTGIRGAGVRFNGTSSDYDQQFQTAQTGSPRTNTAEIFQMDAGEYLEVFGYQTSGGSLNLEGGNEGDSWANLRLLGAVTATPYWTNPMTWFNGRIATDWRLNTHVRDNENALRYLGGEVAKVSLSDQVSISPGERNPISWDVPLIQVGGVWDSGADFTAQYDGWYMLLVHLQWAAEAAGNVGAKRGCGYKIKNADADEYRPANNDLQFQSGSQAGVRTNGKAMIRLAEGEKVGVYGLHDADQSLTIDGGAPDRSRCSMHFVYGW